MAHRICCRHRHNGVSIVVFQNHWNFYRFLVCRIVQASEWIITFPLGTVLIRCCEIFLIFLFRWSVVRFWMYLHSYFILCVILSALWTFFSGACPCRVSGMVINPRYSWVDRTLGILWWEGHDLITRTPSSFFSVLLPSTASSFLTRLTCAAVGWASWRILPKLAKFNCNFFAFFSHASILVWNIPFDSLFLFFFSESRFSTGILQKLFQGTAKPSSAETIDNRVDPARQEVGKVGYVAAPIHSGIIRLGRSQDCKADGRNVARYECEDCNDDSFGSLDITLKSGLSLESR